MDKKKSLESILEHYPIRFTDMVIDEDIIWFSACNFNGIFKGSLSNGTLEYIGKFPEKGENGYGLHNFITKFERTLFFGATCSGYIVEYDILKNQFIYYRIPGLEQVAFPHSSLVGQFENYLVIWNTKNVDVIRFDMKKRIFEEVKSCKDSILTFEYLNKKECVKYQRGFCIKGSSLYIPSVENNIILQIDMKKNEKKLHFIDKKIKVHSICSNGEKLWITNACNQLLELELPLGKTKECIIEKGIPVKDAYFAVCFNNCLYFALREIDEILVYDLESKKTERIEMCMEETQYNRADGFSLGTIMIRSEGNKIWAFNSTYSTLQCIEGNRIRKQRLELIGNVEQFILDRKIELRRIGIEDKEWMLRNFLRGLCEEAIVDVCNLKEIKQEYKSIGSKILGI